MGEMHVDFLVVERDALALQSLENEVVDGPEGVFGERVGAQSVLVAHHHKAEIQFFADESQVLEHPLHELQFSEGVNLLVFRLFDQRTVAVDE